MPSSAFPFLRVEVAGHRGAAGLAPENTLPAFRKALELGVRMVELDVRLTRDGVPVCFHDDRLDRLTGLSGSVGELDWAELSRVAVMPGAFGGAYREARIPLLREVLEALPAESQVLVELKPESVRARLLVERTLETTAAAGGRERCRFISFDGALLRWLQEYRDGPRLRLGVLVGTAERALLLDRARELGAEAVHPQQGWVDPELLGEARERGFLVNAWTVNSPVEARRLAALGVDEITTDYPDMVLAALAGPTEAESPTAR